MGRLRGDRRLRASDPDVRAARDVDAGRSRIMKAVGRTDTKPEMIVRRSLHALGLRFRLHRKDLAGTPDIVLPKFRTVIFVHGCFWHRHEGCSKASMPKTRVDFWTAKFLQNVARDRRNEDLLRHANWRVITIWECETRNRDNLVHKLRSIFRS